MDIMGRSSLFLALWYVYVTGTFVAKFGNFVGYFTEILLLGHTDTYFRNRVRIQDTGFASKNTD
jgi:hypothetical protein